MKIIKIFFLLLILNFKIFSFNFFDLSDDTVLVQVGTYLITMLDFKAYISGFKSINNWDIEKVTEILNIMIIDKLIQNACYDENIEVTDSELLNYTYDFFYKRSINYKDKIAIELYFSMNDPFYNIDDFYLKSSYSLLKIKYFSKKGYITKVKSYIIFLSTEKLSKKEKDLVKDKAIRITRIASSGNDFFVDLVKEYSEDKETKSKNGDIGIIELNNKFIDIFGKENVLKILSIGLFNPLLIETKKGFYIIMNYDYIFPEDKKFSENLVNDLSSKYPVKKMISFTNKNIDKKN